MLTFQYENQSQAEEEKIQIAHIFYPGVLLLITFSLSLAILGVEVLMAKKMRKKS